MNAWALWAVLLLLQNASFTWVSRARNSSSISYHAVAAVASNAIFFANLAIAVDKLADIRRSGSVKLLLFAAAFYTVFTVIGSVGMHHFLMTKVEKGRRRVGT